MTAAVMISAAVATNKLRARFGPRPLVVTGMALGAAGMLYLSGLGVNSSYATAILPALIAIGVGLGLSMASAMNSATLGVDPADAGVASATVSASQQIGGSLGTALLSTIATSALTTYIAGAHGHVSQALIAQASVHADTTAFTWAAAIFAIGAVLAGSLFERGTKALDVEPGMAPALAH
jgi:MFS family permease